MPGTILGTLGTLVNKAEKVLPFIELNILMTPRILPGRGQRVWCAPVYGVSPVSFPAHFTFRNQLRVICLRVSPYEYIDTYIHHTRARIYRHTL